ncbi:hypothetical protein MPLSOD_340122 [Mesorhizobium sp. SOD10]|nr:hypothetical protein MPLSOD_340122 [Mesorhizobium sp. SOD10]
MERHKNLYQCEDANFASSSSRPYPTESVRPGGSTQRTPTRNCRAACFVLFRRDGKLRELQGSIIRLAVRRALRQMILSHEDRPFALRYKFHRMMFVWRHSLPYGRPQRSG